MCSYLPLRLIWVAMSGVGYICSPFAVLLCSWQQCKLQDLAFWNFKIGMYRQSWPFNKLIFACSISWAKASTSCICLERKDLVFLLASEPRLCMSFC